MVGCVADTRIVIGGGSSRHDKAAPSMKLARAGVTQSIRAWTVFLQWDSVALNAQAMGNC